MFEFEKTVTIGINIDKILDMINDDIFVVTADDDNLIRDFVDDYVSGLDDELYYLIEKEDKNKIVEEVKRRLKK